MFNKQEVIFVYDTIVIYDTIRFVHITEIDFLRPLSLDSIDFQPDVSKARTFDVRFYTPQPATFSSSGIITDENQLKMKKRNFFWRAVFCSYELGIRPRLRVECRYDFSQRN